MKKFTTKRISLAGFLASGFTILSGLVVCLVMAVVFSESPGPYVAVVLITFGVIMLIPLRALRPPKDRAEKKGRRWRWPWPRRRERAGRSGRYWKRKRGQVGHQPFGTPDLPRPSTFVAAPRKPTDP